ncbi:MAG: hypothetical protein WA049_08185 [Ferribacterium limneticum]
MQCADGADVFIEPVVMWKVPGVLLHRNSVQCLVLVRAFAFALSTTPINQCFASLARRLRSKAITAIFRQRGWADGDDAMR